MFVKSIIVLNVLYKNKYSHVLYVNKIMLEINAINVLRTPLIIRVINAKAATNNALLVLYHQNTA